MSLQIIYSIYTVLFSLESVLVLWQPNSEPDLAGYRIYYGLRSGDYPHVIDVGNNTSWLINDLTSGNTYFFAVTAYDISGNESDFSEEVSIYLNKEYNDIEEGESTLQLVYNFPNPMTLNIQNTWIRYYLVQDEWVSIQIYDMNHNLIQTILDETMRKAGEHTDDFWDGKNANGNYVASGVYICKIKVGRIHKIIRIVTIR